MMNNYLKLFWELLQVGVLIAAYTLIAALLNAQDTIANNLGVAVLFAWIAALAYKAIHYSKLINNLLSNNQKPKDHEQKPNLD